MKRLFITATGTDIGKTLITAALTWQLKQRGIDAKAIKPVASGYDAAHAATSDAGLLLAAQSLPLSDIDCICPWRFAASLSPDMAAEKEGRNLALADIVAFCDSVKNDIILIEGAGGVMSPVTAQHTVLDWIEALAIPALLVTGSYLGAISHTLTALAALTSRDIAVHAVVISESADSPVSADAMRRSLASHGVSETVIILPRQPASAEMWKTLPNFAIELL